MLHATRIASAHRDPLQNPPLSGGPTLLTHLSSKSLVYALGGTCQCPRGTYTLSPSVTSHLACFLIDTVPNPVPTCPPIPT